MYVAKGVASGFYLSSKQRSSFCEALAFHPLTEFAVHLEHQVRLDVLIVFTLHVDHQPDHLFLTAQNSGSTQRKEKVPVGVEVNAESSMRV